MDGQGSVAVRLETLMEGGVRLSVRDSGPGMDRDLAAPARSSPSSPPATCAAGLGLLQAYAFARQSGGTLAIDSAPGEGAEVSITLPQAALNSRYRRSPAGVKVGVNTGAEERS